MKKIFIIQIVILIATIGAFLALRMYRGDMTVPAASISSSGPLVFDPVKTATANQLVNPAVLTDLGKHYIINFKPLRDTIESIQKKYDQGTYVYFLYLNNGAWIGLNEKELFTAASTLKVPLAMALMRAVDENKIKLSDEYNLDKLNLDSNFGDLYKVGVDKKFKVDDLLKIMLEKSDNTAMNAIFEIFNRIGISDPLGDVYNVLGWGDFAQEVPEFGEAIDYSKINLKTLSNMFLALYNAKYIDVDDSNTILTYLSQSPFDDKIVAGVPENVVVSHKIGTAAPESTYSDCGIVYAPNRHYLICLGSNGAQEDVAAKFMAEVSKAVYSYVINN